MTKRWIGWILVGVACAMTVAIWARWDDWFVKPGLRAGLEASLKDPFSVQYRNDKVMPGGGILCGEYNAKNGYGAFAGFQRFVANGQRYAVEGSSLSTWDDSTDAIIKRSAQERAGVQPFQALWDEYCQATASGN